MVGVVTSTSVRSGPGSTPRHPESRYFVSGLADRGTVGVPHRVASMKDFIDKLGDSVSYSKLFDDLTTFFAEGGTEAYVARVVGPSATVGTLTLADRAGTPLSTIRIDANAPGSWSSNLTVTVVDGVVTNTVTITISYKGGADVIPDEVYLNVGPVPADIVAAINGRSRLVVATDLASATAAPGNRPKTLVATALSAGTDDRSSVTGAMAAAAFDTSFPSTLGPGLCATPGFLHTDVAATLGTHCKNNNRVAVLCGAETESTLSVQSNAATIQAGGNGEYLLVAYPWVKIPTGLGSATKNIPPTGFYAGVRSRVAENEGVWLQPAGKRGEARYVVGIVTSIDAATNNTLFGKYVSALRVINGKVRPYGWRSLSTDDANYHSLTARDTLNAVAWAIDVALEDEVFDGIDSKGVNIARAISVAKGTITPMADAGAFIARDDGPGYSVTGTANSLTRSMTITAGIRPIECAETIYANIVKVAPNAPV